MAVQIILKNSSIEDKRPQASQLTNGEISLNYSSAGAFLCCTDTNGDVQQVGGVKIDETAPDAPVKQTLWFKPSTLTLSVFDGDKWLPIAGGGGGGTPGGGDIIQIIGNDGIDADTVSGIVTLDVELAGGDDGLEFKSSKLSATLASATDLGSVKVGDNINVTAGKISVPKATSSTFGVVKLGDGIEIDGDGSISIDVPTTTTYRGSCDLNSPPTGQINPDPALKGDAYINSADAPVVDAGWTGITGSAKIGDLVIFDGTTWDLIPLGAGTAPVTSVNGKTGDVVLDYTDVGAASEAQGELADTALQPGDNISELNNDEGYITAAEAPVLSVNGKTGVVVLDAADVGALAPGDNVSLLANDAEYISKGDPVSDLDNDAGYITLADLPDIPDQEPPVIISDTAPTGDDAVEGNLWFNSNDGRTYVYYKDGDSSQWVDASPDSGGAGGGGDSLWLEAGGYLSPKTGTNGVDIGGSKIQLNADGSINAAGGDFSVASNGVTTVQEFDLTKDDVYGSQLIAGGLYLQRPTGNTGQAFAYYDGKKAKTLINRDGSSQFAGDMAIGTTGSYTPSTPAISLNADGSFSATCAGIPYDYAYRFAVTGVGDGKGGVRIDVADLSRTAPALNIAGTSGTCAQINGDGSAEFKGDIQSTSQNGGPLAGFRNKIINGGMDCWERGDAFYNQKRSDEQFTSDRWKIFCADDNSGGGFHVVKDNNAPNGFTYSMKIVNASGVSAPGYGAASLLERVENLKTFSGGKFTLSCLVQAGGAETTYFNLYSRTNYGTGGSPSSAETQISETFGSHLGDFDSTSWTRISWTFDIPDLSGKTFGTDENSYLEVGFSGIGLAKSQFVFVTGVQLEPGPVATVFEHRPIGTELALCQRYYYKPTRNGAQCPYLAAYKDDFLQRQYTEVYPTTMRAAPRATANATNITGAVGAFPSVNSTYIEAAVSNAQASNGSRVIDLEFDAEL